MSGPGSSSASETFEQTTFRRSFDVWNEVPLVAQSTGMSCWAAAAAMLIGWRERLAVNPDEVARGAGRWSEFKNGLHPEDVAGFADQWGLVPEEGDEIWAVDRFRRLLDQYGPLWVGEASPGLHAVVITGLFGDGTPEGTHVRVNDPWPVGAGERYTISFRQLRENFDAASRLTGDRAHVLHSGGRGHRIADARHSEQNFSRTVHYTERIGDAMSRYGRGAVIDVESLEVRAGDRYIDTTRLSPDPLAGHGGTGDNLYLAWNAIPDDATSVDVVVHLHGYSPLDATRPMLERKVTASGLDLTGRTRPTLAILPRGRKITVAEFRAEAQAGGHPNASRYTFPAITAQQGAGLERLIQFALATFGRDVLGGRTVGRGRLIITAHSGAGQALESLVQHASARAVCNPHEVHIYDALYSPSPNIAAWVRSRVATDQALLSQPNSDAALARDGGGCRIIYGAGTQANSAEVSKSFPASGPLRQAYRAEATRVEHGDIPRVFGRALLTSVRADLVVVPSRAKAQSIVQPLDFASSGLAADDDARAWLTSGDAARNAIAPSVRSWVLATDRSAIELLADASRRTHFLTEVNWQHQDFPKKGKTQTAETESLFNAMERVVSERRANSTATGIRYHNVDAVVVSVPGNGNTKLFPEAKDAFVRTRDAARADGVTLTILSAFRSAATQDRIKAGNKDGTAVAQGTSSHTYGLAIDLALSVPDLRISEISTASMTNMVAMYRSPVYKWMALNGRRFGWFPYRREPWHWEYNPEGFKARFEASGSTGGALAYGAPTGLFDRYAPTESLDDPKAGAGWQQAVFRAIHNGERRINRLVKIGRDAGGSSDATVRQAVLAWLKVPFPKSSQAGGITCEQHVRKVADAKPDTPRAVFTGRYEGRRDSGLHTFWAINQAGTAIVAVRTHRSPGKNKDTYWILRGDVQDDGTAVLFQIDKPDEMWGYLQQQTDRSMRWYDGSYLGADGKRVIVSGDSNKDEILQPATDVRPTMMESLIVSDDKYLNRLLLQREWFPLTKTTYEFLRDSAGSDLLRDLLDDYLKLPVGITYAEKEAKKTAGALVFNYMSQWLWDGSPGTSPDIMQLHPRLKAFGERAHQFIPFGHHNNVDLARHVAKLWLAHAKLNHEGEKRTFLDWLTKLAYERQNQKLADLLDIPIAISPTAGQHRYRVTLTVVSFGYYLGYAEGTLKVEKLTAPKWPGNSTLIYDVTAATGSKGLKLPSRDEVFDLVVTTDQEWSPNDFNGSLWLGEATASAGIKGGTGGATLMGGYIRSHNGFWIALEDADVFVKPGGTGGKQGKPKFSVSAQGMVGSITRHTDTLIDLSKPYFANRSVTGDLSKAAHFCFDSSLLTPAARQMLRVVCADQLAALASPRSEIWIVGHTDRVGTNARNLELSQLRAKNVRQALIDVMGPALKVPVGNIHDIGFSEWLAALKLHPNEVKNPDDRRVDLLINGALVATFRES